MDPNALIPPESPIGYPMPFWLIEILKVFGFSLHVMMMNIWYAGAILAAGFGLLGRGNARLVGHHIARALPFVIALGINFGIVPLLFIQAAYYQFFYPATILMAWPWFAVFWLVIMAYTGAYLYRLMILGKVKPWAGKAGGWIAGLVFIAVGFIFANAMSLLTHVDGWWNLFTRTSVAGASTGLALNFSDASLIPRWFFMFGIALTTTAVFVIIDAAFMSGRENEDYRRYAGRFSAVLYTVGLLWFVGFGSWYIFGTRSEAFPTALADPVMRIIFPLTAISPGLPWLLLVFQWKQPSRKLAALAGVAQFGLITLNAVSRQWLQNVELAPYANLASKPMDLQLSALIIFLLLFAGGISIAWWMIAKIVHVHRQEFVGKKHHS